MKPPLLSRRHFLSSAVLAVPALTVASSAKSSPGAAAAREGKTRLISRGEDRTGRTHPLGDRSSIDFKVTSAETGGDFFMLEHRGLRRFGPPRHVHPDQDEWFYVLNGTYRFEVGEEKFRLGPGDLLFAPRGEPHVWMHEEDADGSMLVAFEPAGKMEAFFEALVADRALPTDDKQALFRAHGMEIVGPALM